MSSSNDLTNKLICSKDLKYEFFKISNFYCQINAIILMSKLNNYLIIKFLNIVIIFLTEKGVSKIYTLEKLNNFLSKIVGFFKA